MFKETANRIDYWTKQIERLEKELEEAKANNEPWEVIADIQMDLYEAKENLNYAWQDDELEEMGLR